MLPPKLAPYQVVLIPIYHNEDEYKRITSCIKKIAKNLRAINIRVKEDFRDTHKPGWKFSEYELKGVPIRIAMGPRDVENNTVELVRRDTLEKKVVNLDNLLDLVQEALENIQENLFLKAKLFQEKNTFRVDDWSDFKEKINLGGFVSAHWDSTSETEDEIKKLTKATIRCLPMDSTLEKGSCILTGKPSSRRVIFAKSY